MHQDVANIAAHGTTQEIYFDGQAVGGITGAEKFSSNPN